MAKSNRAIQPIRPKPVLELHLRFYEDGTVYIGHCVISTRRAADLALSIFALIQKWMEASHYLSKAARWRKTQWHRMSAG